MTETHNDAWFAAKRFGYGAGVPIRWQGWAMVAGHAALICAGLPLVAHSPAAFTAYALVTGFVPLPLYAAKTLGGWKWRWGARD